MKYKFELIVLIVVVAFIAIFLMTSASNPDAEFGGSDGVGSEKVLEITKLSEDEITPIIPQWAPPSGEIESCLFAIQAAFGGIVIGLGFGYFIGQRRRVED